MRKLEKAALYQQKYHDSMKELLRDDFDDKNLDFPEISLE